MVAVELLRIVFSKLASAVIKSRERKCPDAMVMLVRSLIEMSEGLPVAYLKCSSITVFC
jgi:hypothetical protein